MNAVLNYRIHRRFNVGRTKNIGNSVTQVAVSNPREIKTEEDFNNFVLGAMAKRSNGGLVPEHVTYENILLLTKQLRESMAR